MEVLLDDPLNQRHMLESTGAGCYLLKLAELQLQPSCQSLLVNACHNMRLE